MITQMTSSEESKIFEITNRLRGITSPVLRLQAILQFSQIVDILSIGDTDKGRVEKFIEVNDELQKEIDELAGDDEE
jgi:hypothetical protein